MLLLQLHPISIFPIVKKKIFQEQIFSQENCLYPFVKNFLYENTNIPLYFTVEYVLEKNCNKTLLPNRQHL